MRAFVSGSVLFFAGSFPLSAETLFRDDFNGSLLGAWAIVREDGSYLTQTATTLDVRASSGVLAFSPNTAKNVFLIDNPATGDFAITVGMKSYSGSNQQYDQFDILAYDDDDNHVRCDYTYISGRRCLEFGKEEGGNWWANSVERDFGSSPFFLRLTKVGTIYMQSYSTDGTNFVDVNPTIDYGNGTPQKLGFVVSDDPAESSIASIDFFMVTAPAPGAMVRIQGPGRIVSKSRIRVIRGRSEHSARVMVKVGRRPFRRAKGLSRWSFRARLARATNRIVALAFNADGKPSPPAKTTIVYRP